MMATPSSQILTPPGRHGRLGRTIAKQLGMRPKDTTTWRVYTLPAHKQAASDPDSDEFATDSDTDP
jgi:hypothetical protein